MIKRAVSVLLLVAACKPALTVDPADLGSSTADLSRLEGLPDLRGSSDLSLAADLASSCRGASAPGVTYKLATDSLKLPSSSGSGSFTVDFDGDGKAENQFKNLISIINLSGLDVQGVIDAGIAAGDGIELLSFTTTDTANSTCVGVEANSAQPHMTGAPPPRFDGTDVFFPIMPTGAQLAGQLQGGKLATTPPPLQNAATEQRLPVQLNVGGAGLTLLLRGVHVEGTVSKTGGLWRLQSGVLHGVISKADIDGTIIPAFADLLTQLIHKDVIAGVPGDTAKALIGLFEQASGSASIAKCMVAANCCRTSPATCFILPAEVAASPVGGVLSPDVEVLDGSDHWAPKSGGKNYNAMSFGIGFSAVTASF